MSKSKSLMILATPKKNGAAVDMDTNYFVSTFDVGVLNKGELTIVLDKGDYRLFDDTGNYFEVFVCDANLYGSIDPYKYLSGEISFKCSTDNIYRGVFIKWVDE